MIFPVDIPVCGIAATLSTSPENEHPLSLKLKAHINLMDPANTMADTDLLDGKVIGKTQYTAKLRHWNIESLFSII